MSGRSSCGRPVTLSSSAIDRSLGVGWSQGPRWAVEERGQRDGARPDGCGEHDVDENELPRQLRPPLKLPDPHLDEEEREHAEADAEEPRRAIPEGGEIPDREEEREQEGADDGAVDVDRRLERAEAVDVLAAARAGAGSCREGAAA